MHLDYAGSDGALEPNSSTGRFMKSVLLSQMAEDCPPMPTIECTMASSEAHVYQQVLGYLQMGANRHGHMM